MAWLVAFATVYGLTRGAQSFVTSLAWADYFGREAQGAIRGLSAPFRDLDGVARGVRHRLRPHARRAVVRDEPGLGRLLRPRGAGRHPRTLRTVPPSIGRRRTDRRRRPLRRHRYDVT